MRPWGRPTIPKTSLPVRDSGISYIWPADGIAVGALHPNEPSLIRTERSVGYFLDTDVTIVR